MASQTFRAVGMGFATLALVAACDKPKPRGAAARPAPIPVIADSLPPPPEWARSMIGKRLNDLFNGQDGVCVGNTDAVSGRYQGSASGVRIAGWAWNPGPKQPLARVLLTDGDGAIVGAGETGVARPDVNAVNKDITSPTTGWTGYAARSAGVVESFGILPDGKTLCRLGRINL